MVAYDATGGRFAEQARRLVGQSLAPADPAARLRVDLRRLLVLSAQGDRQARARRSLGRPLGACRPCSSATSWDCSGSRPGPWSAGGTPGPAHRASDEIPPERLAEVEAALPKGLDAARASPLAARAGRAGAARLRCPRGRGRLWAWPEELADRIDLLLATAEWLDWVETRHGERLLQRLQARRA